MDEIPADVLKAALECWLGMEEAERIPVEPVPSIARAILAERERCAKACEFRADALSRIHGYRSEVTELRARATFIRTGE